MVILSRHCSHADEVRGLKEKFAQEMQLADESDNRIRALHSNTHLEQLQLLRQSEAETVASLLGKQQQELDHAIQRHSRELERCREEQEKLFEEWQRALQCQVEAQHTSREAEIKERVKQESVREMEQIKLKLREEASEERAALKREAEEKVREERVKSAAHLETQHRSSEKTEEECVSLRREVESLRLRVAGKRSELADTRGELDEEIQRYRVAAIGIGIGRDGQGQGQQRERGGGGGEESNEVLFEFEKTLEGGLLAKRSSLESWIQELRESVEREKERKEKEDKDFHLRVRNRKTDMAVCPLSLLLFSSLYLRSLSSSCSRESSHGSRRRSHRC
jgi:hypothetical protein